MTRERCHALAFLESNKLIHSQYKCRAKVTYIKDKDNLNLFSFNTRGEEEEK